MKDIESEIKIVEKLIARSKQGIKDTKARANFNPIAEDHIILGFEKAVDSLETELFHLRRELRMRVCG